MNCKQAKTKVALLIGNDLDPTATRDVRQHLNECGSCRQHLQRLSACLERLQVPSPSDSWSPESESLWPGVLSRLGSESASQRPHRLSGWAPTLAVAAACTAMFWVASSQWVGGPAIDPLKHQVQPIEERPPGDFQSPPQPRPYQRKSDTMRRGSGIFPDVPVIPVNEGH